MDDDGPENKMEPLVVAIAVLRAQLAAMQDMIRANHAETERRFGDMERELAKYEMDRSQFMDIKTYNERHGELTRWQLEIETWRSRTVGIAIGMTLASGLIASLVMRLLERH